MLQFLVIALCSVLVAAEHPGNVLLRPMAVPGRQQVLLMPHQLVYHQDRSAQKRQVDFNAASSAEVRPKQQNLGRPVPQQRRPQFERPQQLPQQPFQGPKQGASQPQPPRFNPHPPAQKQTAPVPLPDFGADSEEKVERPLRQSPNPFRAPEPLPQRPQAEAPRNRNPEFANGFPSGFTSGLPTFDFQGRMPEPDAKSEGFMDGALRGFPSLKTFGGFDPLPDIRTEVEEPKSPLANRPLVPRPAQRTARSADRITWSNSTNQRLDDEAFLEPDLPSSGKTTNQHQPTDIADIIDSEASEQRFLNAFQPSHGAFRPSRPLPPPAARRPPQVPIKPSKPLPPLTRPSARSPYVPGYEVIGDNSLLGSGNFEVLGGGVFRDASDYQPVNNYNNLNNYNNNNYNNYQQPGTSDYPTSFFDGDFFSNFRDFADVNQDYRNRY